MAFPKKRKPLVFTQEEPEKLRAIQKARSEEKRRTVRAGILLDAASGKMSDQAIARAHGVNRNTVVLCVNKCLRFGGRRRWVSCHDPGDRAASVMRRRPGCCTVLVRSPRKWATPMSCGLMGC